MCTASAVPINVHMVENRTPSSHPPELASKTTCTRPSVLSLKLFTSPHHALRIHSSFSGYCGQRANHELLNRNPTA